ncbi:autophagy-related protein 16-1 isoform X2 [Chrysoperla carnea]|uniref:autophagy-related protein 16-1 isoform X2 n=1 Tax=Chrysoperla carnea TaxID=189513 RepID=UPI001D07466B|nr:autophagy-related protein 16-1 isoform X2 [Chrysoperla carnea]
MAGDDSWRNNIFNQLQERNRQQAHCFQDLILLHNKIFENANTLKYENIQLSIQNEKLRLSGGTAGNGSTGDAEKIQHLEQKLLAQQEELTELHRRKGENSQQIIDLNIKLQEKEKQLQAREVSLADSKTINMSLKAEINMLTNNIRELEQLNQVLRDEHQALQLAFASLEEKLRNSQDENRQLLERLIRYKAKDADKMNEENENFVNEGATSPTAFLIQTLGIFGKRQQKMQKELEEAAKDTRNISPDRPLQEGGTSFTILPTKISSVFDAHDGEVNAVQWSPVDRLLATGGADRKVKLWNVSKGGSHESKGVLEGSNAAVTSVDFDSTGSYVLGASNDMASRVWTVSDQRLKHTLTGHSGKVMAAKFLGEPTKVVSGSHDRTLKIWDLRNRSLVNTKFAGSCCNDLVISDSAGSTIISGHFDKKIRFWDIRTPNCINDVALQGKVTSLDLSRDANYLLSCVRDDTLKLLDLRKHQIIGTFYSDGFKVGCDYTRAAFSPDGQYVACGSADGSVYIWNVTTKKEEVVLKDHGSAVTAVAWNPYGTYLASVDRTKRAIIWGDV